MTSPHTHTNRPGVCTEWHGAASAAARTEVWPTDQGGTAMTDRTQINHGHNRWNGYQWVGEYLSWCSSCRAARMTEGGTAMTDQTDQIKCACGHPMAAHAEPIGPREPYGACSALDTTYPTYKSRPPQCDCREGWAVETDEPQPEAEPCIVCGAPILMAEDHDEGCAVGITANHENHERLLADCAECAGTLDIESRAFRPHPASLPYPEEDEGLAERRKRFV